MMRRVRHIESFVCALLLVVACSAGCFAQAWAVDVSELEQSALSTESSLSSTSSDATGDAQEGSDEQSLRSGGATSVDLDGSNVINTSQHADSTFLYDVSISELTGSSSVYDGQTVQVTGEVVGDKINDSTDERYCWISLASFGESEQDIVYIHMSQESASQIDTFGRYGQTGTILQVRGSFQNVCDTHEGTSDLHADQVSVTQKGTVSQDTFNASAFLPGIVLILLAIALSGIFYYVRERTR